MRLITLAKILILISCIGLSIYLTFIDYPVAKSIQAQYTALDKLKNDPAIDSAENRKRYALNKAAIYQQIDELNKKRHPYWYQIIGILLTAFTGWLIRLIVPPLFKKAQPSK